MTSEAVHKQVAKQLLEGFSRAFGDDTVVTPADVVRMAQAYYRRYPDDNQGLLEALVEKAYYQGPQSVSFSSFSRATQAQF